VGPGLQDRIVRRLYAPLAGTPFQLGTTFSFNFEGMCDLFDKTYLDYHHIVNDPEADGEDRKVRNAGFETPTQDNLEKLFKVMNRFTRNYLQIYYPSAPPLRRDRQVMAWLEELNKRVPNGVGVKPTDVTRESWRGCWPNSCTR
jgi:hypothetical protein